MGTQATDDANLAAGVKTLITDEQNIQAGIAALASRVSAALAASGSATDPVVEQAVTDLNTLHAAMTGDASALAAIAPASSTPAAPAPTSPAPAGETPIGS